MEAALLKRLLSKDFYAEHKGGRCPHKIFSPSEGKIKTLIDEAMIKYDRDLTVEEVSALFFGTQPQMTTANGQPYEKIFSQMRSVPDIGNDIASDVVASLFKRYLGREIATLGVDYINDEAKTLESLRALLTKYSDDFIPEVKVEWDDIEFETIREANRLSTRWKFNLPTLADKLEGVNEGQLIFCAARPNTGKTSFHASMIAGKGGFAEQGASCIILCNEEKTTKVAGRYLGACSGMTEKQIDRQPDVALHKYLKMKKNIRIKDTTGYDMNWVESVCKTYNPDILVLDMGDKFADVSNNIPQHEALKRTAIHARMIAKEYGCALFYMSQLSADAQGIVTPNQSMLEGSKTGKAAEADLMILLSSNVEMPEMTEDQRQERHITIAKNKLNGWHGTLHVRLDHETARYSV